MSEILNAKLGSSIATLAGGYSVSSTLKGPVSLVGDTTIHGDLIVDGDFTNSGGYALNVDGDLIVSGVFNFSPGVSGLSQGNCSVQGDFILGVSGEFHVTDPVTVPTFTVGGSMIGQASEATIDFDGSAQVGVARALQVNVFGDAMNINFILNGHDADSGHDASHGGTVIVNNDFKSSSMTANGGNSSDPVHNVGGNGGGLTIDGGDLTAFNNISLNAGNGEATAGFGGTGGTLNIFGDLVGFIGLSISMTGGTGGAQGGLGGTINITGTVNGGEDPDTFPLGAVTISNFGGSSVSGTGGNAGTFTGFNGPCSASILAYGGDGATNGGNGASIIFDVLTSASIKVYGGAGTSGTGGSSGSITCNEARCRRLDLHGGDGGTAGGSAGNIVSYGDLVIEGFVNISKGSGGTGSDGFVQIRGDYILANGAGDSPPAFTPLNGTVYGNFISKQDTTLLGNTTVYGFFICDGVLTLGGHTLTAPLIVSPTTFTVDSARTLQAALFGSREAGGGADSSGSGTLSGGTVTITTSTAKTTSRIFITDTTTGSLTNVGDLVVTTKNNGSFVVTSTNPSDTSTFDWFIINPY